MLDKIIFTILSRGELSLSLLIAAIIIIYFYIHNISKDLKDIVKKTTENKNLISSMQDKLGTVREDITTINIKLSTLEDRIEKTEERVEKTDDMIVSLSLNPSSIPGIGNGHKKMYAKIIAAISQSISDSYDLMARTLFFMWIDNKLPDKKQLPENLEHIFSEIENIQLHAVSILPEQIQGQEIKKSILNSIYTCLELTKDSYFKLSEAIIDLLHTFPAKQYQDIIEIIFILINKAQVAEIQIYSDEISKAFTEAIKAELVSRKSFLLKFLEEITDEHFSETIAEKITAQLSKITLEIYSIKSELENGIKISQVIKRLQSNNRKKKRTTKKN